MIDALTWMIAIAALALGGAVMAVSVMSIVRRQEVTARLTRIFLSDREHETIIGMGLEWLERLGRRLEGTKVNREQKDLVLKAGFFQSSALYVFVALRHLAAAIAAIAMLTLLYEKNGGLVLFDFVVAIIFGYFFYRYTLIALKLYVDRRAATIRRELPPVLDIMLMALDAGVSIDQCMRYVANVTEGTAPVTGKVLRRHIADIDAGMPYEAALERLGQRLGIEEGQDLAETIKQALFHGGELGTTLRRFSVDLTEKRMAAVREQVGRKSPHLTLVMIVFFMPVLLVVLAGPAVVNLTGALQTAGEQFTSRGSNR